MTGLDYDGNFYDYRLASDVPWSRVKLMKELNKQGLDSFLFHQDENPCILITKLSDSYSYKTDIDEYSMIYLETYKRKYGFKSQFVLEDANYNNKYTNNPDKQVIRINAEQKNVFYKSHTDFVFLDQCNERAKRNFSQSTIMTFNYVKPFDLKDYRWQDSRVDRNFQKLCEQCFRCKALNKPYKPFLPHKELLKCLQFLRQNPERAFLIMTHEYQRINVENMVNYRKESAQKQSENSITRILNYIHERKRSRGR